MANKNGKAAGTNDVEKKIADTRKEWSKEWGIEKQTEGLDKVQANSQYEGKKSSEDESKKNTKGAECGCKYF